MSDQSGSNASRNALWYESAGFWWTTFAVVLIALAYIVPEIRPLWFVEPTGQVGAEGSPFGTVEALATAGLLLGYRTARWLTAGFLAFMLFFVWQTLTIPGFREHLFGWLLVAVLYGAALTVLAFAPPVRRHFAKSGSAA